MQLRNKIGKGARKDKSGTAVCYIKAEGFPLHLVSNSVMASALLGVECYMAVIASPASSSSISYSGSFNMTEVPQREVWLLRGPKISPLVDGTNNSAVRGRHTANVLTHTQRKFHLIPGRHICNKYKNVHRSSNNLNKKISDAGYNVYL